VYSPGVLIWESQSSVGLEGHAGSLYLVPLVLQVTMLCAVLHAFVNPKIKQEYPFTWVIRCFAYFISKISGLRLNYTLYVTLFMLQLVKVHDRGAKHLILAHAGSFGVARCLPCSLIATVELSLRQGTVPVPMALQAHAEGWFHRTRYLHSC